MDSDLNKYSQLKRCWLKQRRVNTKDGAALLLWEHIHLPGPIELHGSGPSAAWHGPHPLACSRCLAVWHLQSTHMLFCISNSTSCCFFPPLASLCLWLFMPMLTHPGMLLLLRLINRKQKQMIKWAVFLCFGSLLYTRQTVCVGGEAVTHIMQNAAGLLLYLITKLPCIASFCTELKTLLTYWCYYHTGGGEEISSLLQPQWRASSSQSGEVSHSSVPAVP